MVWDQVPREEAADLGAHIVGRYAYETPTERSEVLDIALLHDEAFLAVRFLDKKSGARRVYAGICLIDKGASETSIQVMTEHTAPPILDSCPKRILDRLSDTNNPNALEWRGRCHARIDAIAQGLLVEQGHVLEFATPVRFQNGEEHTALIYEGPGLFRSIADGKPSETLYQVPGWQSRPWAVVQPTPEATVTWDFKDGRGQVRAHRHPNGGGLVATSAWVDPAAYVGRDAAVGGFARVYGKARIEDRAILRDLAVVVGHAVVREDAVVSGHARISEQAVVKGVSKVLESAHVHGESTVEGYATVKGSAIVRDRAVVGGRATIQDGAQISEQASVDGKAVVADAGMVRGVARVSDRARITGRAMVGGTAEVLHSMEITGDERVMGDNKVAVLPVKAAVRP